jgi:pteridine reductase
MRREPDPGTPARVALVTGAARRVGRAIALSLAEAGLDVAVHYRHSRDAASATCDAIRGLGRSALAVRGDLAEPDSWAGIVQEVVRAFGRLDVLINNASEFLVPDSRASGAASAAEVAVAAGADTLERFDPEVWDHMLRVNTTAPVGLCHHAAPYLSAAGGHVVNLCDAAVERPWREHLAYCASKAALVCVTRALARALAPKVLVNGISPGIAEFPECYPPEVRERLIRRVPLGRAGTPDDIARLVCFLVTENRYITGEIIMVDGGRSLAG